MLRATLRESREAQEETLAEQSAQLTHEMQSRAREQVATQLLHKRNLLHACNISVGVVNFVCSVVLAEQSAQLTHQMQSRAREQVATQMNWY